MRLPGFRGGIHPEGNKQLSAERPIEVLPLPPVLRVPLQQHIGAPAEPVVRVGQRVLKGELLAQAQGPISAPVHAPSSGTVTGIGDLPAPHPSGLPIQTITLETDGEDRWADTGAPVDPFELEPEAVAARAGAAGIVGMGGATFPSSVKLALGKKYPIHTLVINGAECEPYLTCDDRLMRERTEQVVDGIRIMLHALQARRALIAVEDNKPQSFAALSAACRDYPALEVARIPTRYPMGSEKHLVLALTGKEVPAHALSADIGIIVHNVGTAYAVHEALRFGRPLVSRIVTVSGGAVREPRNLEVPVGTLISDLIDHCGGLAEEPARLLLGGPMMGQVLPHTQLPVVKGSSGILALTAREATPREAMPCIRCGRCVSACPCGLMPLEMTKRIRSGDLEGATGYGLMDCVACGSCAYVCPAHIPLVQYFNYAKGELAERQRAQQKAQETKRLAEQRRARLERQAREKAEAAARRKAARAGNQAQAMAS